MLQAKGYGFPDQVSLAIKHLTHGFIHMATQDVPLMLLIWLMFQGQKYPETWDCCMDEHFFADCKGKINCNQHSPNQEDKPAPKQICGFFMIHSSVKNYYVSLGSQLVFVLTTTSAHDQHWKCDMLGAGSTTDRPSSVTSQTTSVFIFHNTSKFNTDHGQQLASHITKGFNTIIRAFVTSN